MSKLHHRKFARYFPSYHPRKGEPTYFVEKIVHSLHQNGYTDKLNEFGRTIPMEFIYTLCADVREEPKHHTIRAGHHVKPGDFLRMSVWSGKPYASKQIIIAPDVEVKKTWDFEFEPGYFSVNGRIYDGEIESHHELLEEIAANDGLGYIDFKDWFLMAPKKKGDSKEKQIICWSDSVNY